MYGYSGSCGKLLTLATCVLSSHWSMGTSRRPPSQRGCCRACHSESVTMLRAEQSAVCRHLHTYIQRCLKSLNKALCGFPEDLQDALIVHIEIPCTFWLQNIECPATLSSTQAGDRCTVHADQSPLCMAWSKCVLSTGKISYLASMKGYRNFGGLHNGLVGW